MAIAVFQSSYLYLTITKCTIFGLVSGLYSVGRRRCQSTLNMIKGGVFRFLAFFQSRYGYNVQKVTSCTRWHARQPPCQCVFPGHILLVYGQINEV